MEAYQIPGTLGEVDDLFDQAVKQDNLSEVLAYSAIGIWLVDMVWTIMGSSNLNDVHASDDRKGISIGTTFEPQFNVPLLSLRYSF